MSTSTFWARGTVGRWVGDVADLALVFSQAEQLMAAASGESGIAVHVTVEQSGLTVEHETVEAFVQETRPTDLEHIESISALVHTLPAGGEEITVRISCYAGTGVIVTGGAVVVRVSGPDRTVVEGVAAQLRESANRGARFPGVPGERVAGAAAGLGLLALMVLLFSGAVDSLVAPIFDLSFGLSLAVFLAGSFALLGLVAVPWLLLFPAFEWLPPDGRSRWDRSRSALAKFAVAVAVAVVAAVIVAAVT